ncbi:hypothetical protein L7F22_021787 [Adiantum nelumboides]|nr:hypothetical protein [Adiantum nelumboides]
MIYPDTVESAPRSKSNGVSPLQDLETGLLPLPSYTCHSSPVREACRGSDVRRIKARKCFSLNETNLPTTPTPDLSVCRILQRSKQDDSAIDTKGKDCRGCADGLLVSTAASMTHSSVKVVHSRSKNEKLSAGIIAAKPIMAKTPGRNALFANGQHVEEQEKFLPKGLARLRRTTTEPPVVKHIGGQYTRSAVHIALSNPRFDAYACRHQACENGVNSSCAERWAGPAYSSSPPPSSLPLPKLCLSHPKLTSVRLPPLLKQCSASVYTQAFVETSAPPLGSFKKEESWDAVFATKSLRRLLNLDTY